MNFFKKYVYLVTLVLSIALFRSCSSLIVNEPADSKNTADFDAAWQTVKSVYPFFEFKDINWDSVRSVYRPLAEKAKGDEINGVLFNMLAVLKDGHVSLETMGGATVSTYHPPRVAKDRYSYNPIVVRKYFNEELLLTIDQEVEYGLLEGNIGYVYIATLSKSEPIASDFDKALSYFKNTKGLIVDVRNNSGGSDYNSMSIVSRLIDSTMDGFPYPDQNGILQKGYPIYPRGPFTYKKPVVMLINGACFSACEDFAEFMKHVPTVTAVGDTTAGASGAPKPFVLPSGRIINVSTLCIRRYDGQPIEWNGVLPDILLPQTEADIKAGRDPQLEYAIKYFNR